jgi:sugar lactone lactonase YvrE/transcriptional regulator with XRE-family HTH domain
MTTQELPSFAVLLSRYRAAARLTQEELAERAGLSVRGISDLERGARMQPRLSTIDQLAEALKLSRDDRTTFEQAGLAASRVPPLNDALPEGTFLGALPTQDLVAREEERGRFGAALDTVAEGAGHLLLLGGEIGVGKTRLLQELMLVARARGSVVATARCYASEQETAYYPFLEALSELSGSMSARLGPELQRAWKRIQHLAVGDVSDGSAAESSAVAQRELFGAVTDLLQLVTRSVPAALLVDDLQWADAGSLKLLQHLAHTTRSSHILIAATFRDARLTEEHPELAHTIQTLGRERLAERLTIRRLSLEETTQLVAATMGQSDASEEFASFVYRRTKGVPRLIDQLVRSLGGRLELQGEIGAGSMGRVFRAFDRTTGSTVAAKLVLARTEIDLETLLRFQQEGAVLATLEHPHIVDVYDTFADEHATCIIMELLEGQSLGQILHSGPLSLARAKHLALQVAEALSYAHAQQIVHRDIKPDNVMVLPDDQVKVTDFGIARLLQPDTSLQTIATTGMRMGTPLYMAPEQIEGKKVDGRTDVYGLGAMLYHMVTGRPPFEGSDTLAIAIKHLQEEPVPPSQVNPTVPADWDAVILTAMAKDPARRFQRAIEMKEALAGLPTQGSAPSPTLPRPEAPRTPQARPRLPALTPVVRTKQAPTLEGGARHGIVSAEENQAVLQAPPARRLARVRRPTISSALGASLLAALAVGLAAGLIGYTHRPLASSASSTLGRSVAGWGSARAPRLDFPAGVAVDRQGIIYVADKFNGVIQRLSPDGVALAPWGAYGAGPGQFSRPAAVAVDRSGDVYVADTGNGRIQTLSPSGQPIAQWPTTGQVQALTVDRRGNVYTADGSSVDEWSLVGTHLHAWRNLGAAAVAVDARGNVFVIDGQQGRVVELSPQGKQRLHWELISKTGTVSDAVGVVVASTGQIYVADRGDSRIQIFSPAGRLLRQWGSYGAGPGQFEGLAALALDAQGEVVAADGGNNRIQMFSASSRPLAQWGPSLPGVQMAAPEGTAVDAQGNVYVTDSLHNRLVKLSPAGTLLQVWGGPGRFQDPYGIALDRGGSIYVTEQVSSRLDKLSPTGELLWRTGGGAGGPFNALAGVATDSQGNVYVADAGNNRIVVVSASGHYLREWGTAGPATGDFQSPFGIAVDATGHVYVADSLNNRIQQFSSTGTYLDQWGDTGPGSGGTEPGQFHNPEGLAVDPSGNVYVSDTGNDRIQELAPNGHVLAILGSSGSRPGQFKGPTGIVIDRHGNVYIADTGNNRVQKVAPIR